MTESADYARWKWEQDRAVAERAHDQTIDFGNRANEAAVASGMHVMRALILINGAAAIALLAFISHIVEIDGGKFSAKLADLTAPLIWFAAGAATCTVGLAFAYLTNYCIGSGTFAQSHHYEHPYVRKTTASKRWAVAATTFQAFAILAAICSMVTFLVGMVGIRSVIVDLP